MVVVSACLLGVRCRFGGGSATADALCDGAESRSYIPVCPEQLGGLTTPREKACLKGGDGGDVIDGKATVVTEEGSDVTAHYVRGAEEVLRLALMFGARKALLKENSPSCGVTLTHRESGLTEGKGVTAALLARYGIELVGV